MDKTLPLHWVKPQKIEKTAEGKFILPIKTGMIIVNKYQLDFLEKISDKRYSILQIEEIYDGDISKIDLLVEYFFSKGILNYENLNRKESIVSNAYFKIRKVYFWTMPKFAYNRLLRLVDKISQSINISIFSYSILFFNIFALFPACYLFYVQNIDLNTIAHNWYLFLIGFISAFVHELALSVYIRKSNRTIKRWFMKIAWGIFISFGTNWSSMMAEKKGKRIGMFLFALNTVISLSSLMVVISYIFFVCKNIKISHILLLMTIGNNSFILLDLYPFILKNDGYQIFQEITNTYRIRTSFFRCLCSLFYPKLRIEWRTKRYTQKMVVVIWGCMFILTIFGLVYAYNHAIRIIF